MAQLAALSDYVPAPLILAFADREDEAEAWAAAMQAVGEGGFAVAPVAALARRLAHGASPRVVAMSIEASNDCQAVAAIADAERFVGEQGGALIANVPIECLDAAMAAAGDDTTVLCKPDFADRVTALAVAIDTPDAAFADANPSGDQLRLKRLADEVDRIARALSQLSDANGTQGPSYQASAAVEDMQFGYRAPPAAFAPAKGAPDPTEIRAILRLRRMRDRFFPGDLFADPAWDMLLDLFAARMEGDNVAVSSLCIAAAVPPTTALRWIKTMTDARLFERHADPMDGRRIFIRLSDVAMDGIQRYFAAANGQARLI